MITSLDVDRPRPGSKRANARQAYDLALAGAAGAVFGLYLYVELIQTRDVYRRDAAAGLLIGGAVGFFLSASGPFRDAAWRKFAHKSTWGTIAGALGGAAGLVLGESLIGWFQGGLVGRALSWAVLGVGIGISQGLAERSWQRLVHGLLGGLIGGAVGGYFFESLRIAMQNRYDLGQGLGIVILGAGLGTFLALAEQVLRRAWVQVLSGRQEGRTYLLARGRSALGLDERAEVGLFADPLMARRHAEITHSGRGYILINHAEAGRTRLNGLDVAVDSQTPLHDGDRIVLGHTQLLFRQR